MKKTALILTLKSLTLEEIKKLDKFLRSPYFTEGKNISSGIIYRYFEILKQHYPEFNKPQLSPEEFYSKLYESGTNIKIMRKIDSDLLKLIEKFLSIEEFEASKTEPRRNVLNQLARRNIDKLFSRRFKEMLSYLETMNKDEDYFYETYNTWNNYWTHYFFTKSVYKLEESVSQTNNFFIYVILSSLRIYLWRLSYFSGLKKKTSAAEEFYLYDEIMNHIKMNYNNFKHIPQIFIYYNLIKMITSSEEEHFFNLKKLKNKHIKSLANMDKYNLFIMMTNYCHIMISRGNIKFRRERFILDKEFLSSELVDWLGAIHFFQFVAITKNAIKIGEFEWADKIITEFHTKIEPKYRDFALNYINAFIRFEKKKYNESLELLSKLKIEYSHQKQYVRNLMLQIYYETGEDNTAYLLIDTGRHFIHRDKHLNEDAKKNSLNFFLYTEKLMKARNKNQPDLLFKVANKINKELFIENKDWLNEKINEIVKVT